MKYSILFIIVCGTAIGFTKFNGKQVIQSQSHAAMPNQGTINGPEPWTADQLLPPADLAAVINDPNGKKPVIICVGPGALIKGSIDTGPAKEKENLEKLRKRLSELPKNTNIVIYCGCCPFEHCPNIRPAFRLLNEMNFSNIHLLNLQNNIKTDWIEKGYPQQKI